MMARKRNKLKQLKPTLHILCDGECEKIYFDAYKNDYLKKIGKTVNVKTVIIDLEKSWERIINKQIKGLPKTDVVWIVIDRDQNQEEFLSELENYCKDKNLKLCLNIVCLEYWFFMHFKNKHPKYSKCENIMNDLKKHIKNYSKDQKQFRNIVPKEFLNDERIMYAKRNAKAKRKNYSGVPLVKRNPYTGMDLVLDNIDKFSDIR